MTANKKAVLPSLATLLCYVAFAFFRHRQFAGDADAGLPSFLLLAFFPLWACAVAAVVRHRRAMTRPAAAFCWIVCGLGGVVAAVFVLGLFALVFQ